MANLVELLLIEESGESLALLESLAEEQAWRVGHVKQLHEANETLRQKLVSVAVLDLRLAKGAGEAALSTLKQGWPALEVVVLAPEGDAARGLRALKLGAYDSLARPLDRDLLAATLSRAVEKAQLAAELRAVRAREDELPKLLGESSATRLLRGALAKAAGHDGNVLLLGGPGTGKQLAARSIHSQSSRRKGPFVCFNCSDHAADKLEAELFGSEQPGQGVKLGRFEQASGGSVLLHHVDFLPPGLQAKLLQALQDRGFMRVGGLRFVGMDARVLATAGPQAAEMVKSGQFREDLYWRLAATPLEIPPLSERAEDIEDLFTLFLHRRCRLMRRGTPVVRPEALEALKRHNFPGNVRELQDLVGLVAALAYDEVGLADLPIPLFIRSETNGGNLPLKRIVHSFERQVILRTLRSVRGNQSRAAESLDIHRNTLILKMQELEIPNKKTLKKGKKPD